MSLVLAAVAAFVGGGLVSRITDRPFLRGALRQLLLAGVAAGLTYGIGAAVGAVVSLSRRYQASGPNESSACPPTR